MSHCLMIEILPRVLSMNCKWPKLAFCSEIPLFYSFERWSKYLRLGNRWKLTRLCCSSVDVLPSGSSSRSCDWKLWNQAERSDEEVKNRSENSLLLLNYDFFDVKILITLQERTVQSNKKAVHDPFKKCGQTLFRMQQCVKLCFWSL